MKNTFEKVVKGFLVALLVLGIVAIAFGVTYITCAGIWWLICLVVSREFLWSEALGFWIVMQLVSVVCYDQNKDSRRRWL